MGQGSVYIDEYNTGMVMGDGMGECIKKNF